MTAFQRNHIRIYEDNLHQRGALGRETKNDENSKSSDVGRPALKNVSNIPRSVADNLLKGKAKPRQAVVKAQDGGKAQVKVDENQKPVKTLPVGVKDIDVNDEENHTLCTEYVKDIYSYLHKCERRLKIKCDYMKNQTELTEKMRTILIDWLIQVHAKFNLLQETLYLTVYLLDRYLAQADVKRSELQLVGVTAMLLASKYEEMYAPEIGDFVYITDNAYNKHKIMAMEQQMMKTLQYDLSNAFCLHFLRRNSKAGDMTAEKHTLAKFFMEMTLISYKFVMRLPSQVAAASLFLAIKVLDSSDWTPSLVHYSGYSETELLPIVGDLAELMLSRNMEKYSAVRVKYESSRLLRISRLPALRGQLMKDFTNYATNSNDAVEAKR